MTGEHPTRQLERELKFDLEPGSPLPTLDGLLTLGGARVHQLRAVYLDTPDLLLVRHRITLRRREGGGDEGWHLKLPAQDGPGRWELHAPLTGGPGRWRVPAGHLRAVTDQLGEVWDERPDAERGLVPVAVLRTYRTEVDLLDADGRVVALLCDDVVQADPAGHRWRELEIELVEAGPGASAGAGGSGLLGRVGAHLAAQGVPVADSPSKLRRALGERPEQAEAGRQPDPEGPAADVVLAYLTEQVAVILGREGGVRRDDAEAVHKTRVATRRLRSALRTFRRLLDREVTDPLREEIRWYASVLGVPRDAEVMRAGILADLAALPPDLVLGPVTERVRAELDGEHARGHTALVKVMDGPRYAALVDRLVDLLAEPPWRGRAARPAVRVLPPLVDKAVARAGREWAELREAEEAAGPDGGGLDPSDRLHRVHEVRKRAKAVRYAHEALAPSFGEGAEELASTWEKVTEALGVVQDSVVGEDRLRRLTRTAQDAGEPDLTYGVLVGRQLGVREPLTRTGKEAVAAALAKERGRACAEVAPRAGRPDRRAAKRRSRR